MAQPVLDRQIRIIYDALDTGSNKSAFQSCNKLLKKNPSSPLLKSLKALASYRLNKIEDSVALADDVLAAKPTDLDTLNAMMHVLRALGRHNDLILMFDEAFKVHPTHEELGTQCFFANVRAGNWKGAQQAATKLHRQFKDDRYFHWMVMSTVLQANDPMTPPATQKILLQLAHRILTTNITTDPPYVTADRLYLHAIVHKHVGMYNEASRLLALPEAATTVSTNLSLRELQKEINKLRGALAEEGDKAKERIESGDRNWPEFISIIDAAFSPVASSNASDLPSDESREHCKTHIAEARTLFTNITKRDGYKDRSAWLALIDLAQRERQHGLSDTSENDDEELQIKLMEQYVSDFGYKACCFEDIRPYCADLHSREKVLEKFVSILQSKLDSVDPASSLSSLQYYITLQKLLRHLLLPSSLDAPSEIERANAYFAAYVSGLALGRSLAPTELQPADDLLLLGAQALISAWYKTKDENLLVKAAVALEHGLTKSKHSYLCRLHLICIYRLLAAPALAHDQYRSLDVKSTQNDTLSHFLMNRITTFSLSPIGDITYSQECAETSQIYISNNSDTSEFVVRAFSGEKYTQIPDFIEFEDRLDNSLQRDLIKVDHVRMLVTHEETLPEVIDTELMELKFIYDRVHHDNRDFNVLSNYQPLGQPTVSEQTLMLGPSPAFYYLAAYLRLITRVFQAATDIDEALEEKLLAGDGPKIMDTPETRIPIRIRLKDRKEDDLKELSSEETAFYDFIMSMCDWLEPYHDVSRPPPNTVLLSESVKQQILSSSKPSQGTKASSSISAKATLPPPTPDTKTVSHKLSNGSMASSNSNGHDSSVAITPPPEVVSKYFSDALERFEKASDDSSPLIVLLHIATITQEAFILLSICSARFKQTNLVKSHKLGPLAQLLKELRVSAAKVLNVMSSSLVKTSESLEGTRERRDVLMESCKDLLLSLQIDHDSAFDVVKKYTDARKRIAEGVGKSLKKISQRFA